MDLAVELAAITESMRTAVAPEELQAMAEADARLRLSGLAGRALAPGDRAPAFTLPDAGGKPVESAVLLAQGPLVVTFYRGGWCPYCNLALRALQGRLPDIHARGAALVAISPQLPDGSLSTQETQQLQYPVLSDVGNVVAHAFGIVFVLEESLRPMYSRYGADLPAANGTETFELPLPATYLVRPDGIIAAAFVETDYTQRASPERVLGWIDALASPA